MSRAENLRARARVLARAWLQWLEAADEAADRIGDARLLCNPVAVAAHEKQVATCLRRARESLAEAKDVLSEALAWERRATCCAHGPQRAVCSLKVGHVGAEHHDEIDGVRWAVEERRSA